MNTLLIFPPGWMQFGPYLSIPLLKGYLAQHGVSATLLDLNIEFYDWALSHQTLASLGDRLREREQRGAGKLSPREYAQVCKARLTFDEAVEGIEAAKRTLKDPAAYIDDDRRAWAKRVIGHAANVVEASFEGMRFSLNALHFRCGLDPEKVLSFTESPDNLVRQFYEEAVRDRILAGRYDLVGFSLPAWEQLIPTLTFARALRRDLGSGVHLCMGGNYTTRMVGAWRGLVHPYARVIDSFSVFEGEDSLLRLISALDERTPLRSVPNLVFAERGHLVQTPIETVDISKIPAPDFDGLPLDKYLAPETILPLFTSRSCPYKCSFCTIPYASSEFRQRPPEHIARDVETLQEKHKNKLFTFVDETLTIPSLDGLSRAIIDKQLDVRWYGETRFHHRMDKALAQRMFAAGCRKLQFGVESYNQRVLNRMKKGMRIDDVIPNLEACLSAGIAVHLFTFIGFPGEREDEARQTYDFTQQILELSAEKYGNTLSTVGMGAFCLETYSDVFPHPERYGVRVSPPKTPDVLFDVPYEVESGLTHEEAEALVDEFENKTLFEQICAQLGRLWWGPLARVETNEEEAFILYCLTGRCDLSTEEPAPAPRGMRMLKPGAFARSIQLAPDVRVLHFTRDFIRLADEGGPVTAFYAPDRNLVVRLPARVGVALEGALARGELPERVEPELSAAISKLMRSGLLRVNGDGIDELLPRLPDDGRISLRLNPDVTIVRGPGQQFVLFNDSTEELLRVNGIVAWIGSLLRDGARDRDAFVGEVCQLEPRLTERTLHATLAELVGANVVLATSPGGA